MEKINDGWLQTYFNNRQGIMTYNPALLSLNKSALFTQMPTLKVILLCGEVSPEHRFRLCDNRIHHKENDHEVEDIGVSVHGGYQDFNIKNYCTGNLNPYDWSFYLRKATLTTEDEWDYSIVCNAQAFTLSKLKKIVAQTRKEVYMLCTKVTIRELYRLFQNYNVRPVDWSNKVSFIENILANEFFGKLELVISTTTKEPNFITSFLKDCNT